MLGLDTHSYVMRNVVYEQYEESNKKKNAVGIYKINKHEKGTCLFLLKEIGKMGGKGGMSERKMERRRYAGGALIQSVRDDKRESKRSTSSGTKRGNKKVERYDDTLPVSRKEER